VRTDIFHPGPRTLFTDLPRPVALFVGRVAIEKNIRAFLDMPWPGSKVVVGGGPDFDMLSQSYPDVHFAGMRRGNDLADHYRSADVFVFPSRTETFGIVLIEAMACGLPIAGYPVTGPVDVVTDPVLGSIDSDLEKAAHGALNAPGNTAARFAHLEKHYTWPVAMSQFLEGQAKAVMTHEDPK
jgi:glycosyltransferase involved in cell wall biosynthesis